MKVTDEMVERACTYLNRYYDGKCDLDDARGALQAALADVPEPTRTACALQKDKMVDVLVERLADIREVQPWSARMALEAALADVPEHDPLALMRAQGSYQEMVAWANRAYAAESKLDKVRALVDAWDRPTRRQQSKAGVEVLLVQMLDILGEDK